MKMQAVVASVEHCTYFKSYLETWGLWSLQNEIMESNFRLTLNNLNSLSGVLTVLHDVAKCTINNLSGKTELRLSQL